ncbi:hypothetical protein JCM15519_06900 [Fundidesulfovibrio butyratiphilus]
MSRPIDLESLQGKISANADDFAKDLSVIADAYADSFDLVVQKGIMMFLQQVMLRTPKDTGRATAGWQVSVDSQSDYAPPPGDYRELNPNDVKPFGVAQAIYNIENNVAYILPLENGHSQQAPRGFIALTFAELSDYFRRAAESLGLEYVE